MTKKYDAVIVGAGPAGTTAARYAALGGAKVLILEKRQEVGSPVRCGEGIAGRWLKDVGIEEDDSWITHRVEGAKIVSPGGKKLYIDDSIAGNEVGMVLERDWFDKSLAAMAVRAGADLWLSACVTGIIRKDGAVVGVTVLKDGKKIDVEAGVVVGADGFESQVGRWAGIDTSLSPGDISCGLQYRMVNIKPESEYCEFFLDNIGIGGYIWVFPKGKDEANVGLGMQLSRIKDSGTVKRVLDEWIAENPDYADGKIIEVVSGGVSLSPPLEKTVADGLMLVGDAARMADAMTGGGIATACIAGKACGEVIGQAAAACDFSEGFLNAYEKGWRALLENRLYMSYMAKEKLLALSTDAMDKIVGTLAEVGVKKLSILEILQIIGKRHPELLEELQDLL